MAITAAADSSNATTNDAAVAATGRYHQLPEQRVELELPALSHIGFDRVGGVLLHRHAEDGRRAWCTVCGFVVVVVVVTVVLGAAAAAVVVVVGWPWWRWWWCCRKK